MESATTTNDCIGYDFTTPTTPHVTLIGLETVPLRRGDTVLMPGRTYRVTSDGDLLVRIADGTFALVQ